MAPTPLQIGSAGLSAASGVMGIVGAIKQAKAIERAAKQAAKFEDFKFRQFFEDTMDEERLTIQTQHQQYASSGIDFRHGSPMAVAVDTANEFATGVERKRIETEMVKEQIRLDAAAGRATSIAQGVASGLNAGSSVLGVLGDK